MLGTFSSHPLFGAVGGAAPILETLVLGFFHRECNQKPLNGEERAHSLGYLWARRGSRGDTIGDMVGWFSYSCNDETIDYNQLECKGILLALDKKTCPFTEYQLYIYGATLECAGCSFDAFVCSHLNSIVITVQPRFL